MASKASPFSRKDIQEAIKTQGEIIRQLKLEEQTDEVKKKLKDETAKLLELKNKIDNDQGSQKFVLKTPKGTRDHAPKQMAVREKALKQSSVVLRDMVLSRLILQSLK